MNQIRRNLTFHGSSTNMIACLTLVNNKKGIGIIASITNLPVKLLHENVSNLNTYWTYVIFITKDLENKKTTLIEPNGSFKIYGMGLSKFIELVLNPDQNKVRLFISESIFVFEDYKWSEVVYSLKIKNIALSGGLNTKRHILSTNQYRLVLACQALGITEYHIGESFHKSNLESKETQTRDNQSLEDLIQPDDLE